MVPTTGFLFSFGYKIVSKLYYKLSKFDVRWYCPIFSRLKCFLLEGLQKRVYTEKFPRWELEKLGKFRIWSSRNSFSSRDNGNENDALVWLCKNHEKWKYTRRMKFIWKYAQKDELKETDGLKLRCWLLRCWLSEGERLQEIN